VAEHRARCGVGDRNAPDWHQEQPAAVEEALRTLIQVKRQEEILALRKARWESEFDQNAACLSRDPARRLGLDRFL
jgi:hypothetical protein